MHVGTSRAMDRNTIPLRTRRYMRCRCLGAAAEAVSCVAITSSGLRQRRFDVDVRTCVMVELLATMDTSFSMGHILWASCLLV